MVKKICTFDCRNQKLYSQHHSLCSPGSAVVYIHSGSLLLAYLLGFVLRPIRVGLYTQPLCCHLTLLFLQLCQGALESLHALLVLLP